jgi:hypothetical protein
LETIDIEEQGVALKRQEDKIETSGAEADAGEPAPRFRTMLFKIAVVVGCAWNLISGMRGATLRSAPMGMVLLYCVLALASALLLTSAIRDLIRCIRFRDESRVQDHRNAFEVLPIDRKK